MGPLGLQSRPPIKPSFRLQGPSVKLHGPPTRSQGLQLETIHKEQIHQKPRCKFWATRSSKSPYSIGHRPLQGRCPKRSRSTKNPYVSTGPLAHPFASSLAPLTPSLAPPYSLPRALLCSLIGLLVHSLARSKMDLHSNLKSLQSGFRELHSCLRGFQSGLRGLQSDLGGLQSGFRALQLGPLGLQSRPPTRPQGPSLRLHQNSNSTTIGARVPMTTYCLWASRFFSQRG